MCHRHPGRSLHCDKDYCAAASGLGPFPARGVGSVFLQLLHMLVEKLWGRAWSSKGWKEPRSKVQQSDGSKYSDTLSCDGKKLHFYISLRIKIPILPYYFLYVYQIFYGGKIMCSLLA